MSGSGARVELAGLEAIIRQVREVGRVNAVVIELPQSEIDKAGYLAAGGRDFFSVTPEMRTEVAREVAAAYRAGGLASLETALPTAAKRHIARRFANAINDTDLRALSAKYLTWKILHGHPPLIGVLTGALRDAVAAARVYLQRS